MGAGIFAYFSLKFEPYFEFVLLTCVFTIPAIIGALYYCSTFQKETWISFFLYGLLSLIIGFFIAKIRTDMLSTRMLTCALKDISITGIIKDIEHPPYKKGNKRRMLLTDVSYEKDTNHLPDTVRLNVSDHLIAGVVGDIIKCKVDLLPISPPFSLYGYDFQRQAYFSGIGAVGRVKKACFVIKSAHQTFLAKFRYELTQTLRTVMPGINGQIAAALVTGDRSGIPKDIRQNFNDAGIAHILAISGLHISLVAGFIFLIIRRGFALIPFLAERFFIKKWAAVASIIGMSIYLAISGFGFPAQRAFFMTALAMIGVCLDRSPISMRSLAIAATFILFIFPESILSTSFQLSFAAVIALIATYEGGWNSLKNWVANGHFYRNYLGHGFGIVLTTVIATLATSPLVIYTFNRFTLQAIAGNLVAIPLTSFWIMPAILLAVFSLIFGNFPSAFTVLDSGLSTLILTAGEISQWPGAAILVQTPHFLFLTLTSFGGLWICLWKERWRWLGLIPIGFSIFYLSHDHHPHVYVAEEVIAYRSNDTLNVSSLKRGSFAAETWMKELGLNQLKSWNDQIAFYPSEAASKITLIATPYFDGQGKKRSYLEMTNYVSQYCRSKSWLTSNGYIWKICKNQTNSLKVIDRFQLKKNGTYYIWVNHDDIKMINAAEYFGNRPWRVKINKRKNPRL